MIYGARILSRIFTPFSFPFLSFLILFVFTHLSISFRARDTFYILEIVFRFTIILPIISIFFLHKINHLSYIEQHPRERTIGSFMISTFCYLFIFIVLMELKMPTQYNYIISIIMVLTLFIIIPQKWRFDENMNGLYSNKHSVLSDLNKREQRFMPFLLTIISYIFCTFIMLKQNLPWYLNGIIISALFILVVLFIINAKWRVSEHMAAIGGVTAGVITFSNIFFYNPIKWVCILVILAGALGTARIILKHNNLGEIFAGFIIGLSCTLIALNDTCNHYISTVIKYLL